MNTLEELIEGMKVPEGRKGDLRWLQRNLGIRNREHPRYHEAIKFIVEELKKRDRALLGSRESRLAENLVDDFSRRMGHGK